MHSAGKACLVGIACMSCAHFPCSTIFELPYLDYGAHEAASDLLSESAGFALA